MLTPVIDGLVRRLVGALPAVYANPWTGACPDRRRRDNLINDVDARWMPRPKAAEEEPAGGFGADRLLSLSDGNLSSEQPSALERD
jgi:hypothetical protein